MQSDWLKKRCRKLDGDNALIKTMWELNIHRHFCQNLNLHQWFLAIFERSQGPNVSENRLQRNYEMMSFLDTFKDSLLRLTVAAMISTAFCLSFFLILSCESRRDNFTRQKSIFSCTIWIRLNFTAYDIYLCTLWSLHLDVRLEIC